MEKGFNNRREDPIRELIKLHLTMAGYEVLASYWFKGLELIKKTKK